MKGKKRSIRIALIVVLLVLISICSFFVFYFYDAGKSTFNIKRINTNKRSSVKYNVNLKDNNYDNIDNKLYAKELVKDIDLFYDYVLSFDHDVVGEYSYYIEGNLIFLSDTSTELVKRELYRSSLNKFKIDGQVIDIGEASKIDLNTYLDIYDELVKDYSLKNDASIRFDMHITYNIYGSYINKSISNEDTITVSIPISSNTIKVDTSKDQDINSNIYGDKIIKNNIYIVICLEFIGVIILIILIIILIIKQLYVKDNKKEVNKLLKKYDDIIVEVLDIPDLSKLDVLYVKKFAELLDASNKMNLPIIYFKVKNKNLFAVITEQMAFIYKIK